MVFDEASGERCRRGVISERDPIERTGDGAWRLGVVDEELDISVGAAEVEQLAQCRWSVLPRSQGHAVDDDVLHFEHRTRCGQGSSDFGPGWEARRRSLMRVFHVDRRNRLRTVWKHSETLLPYVPRGSHTLAIRKGFQMDSGSLAWVLTAAALGALHDAGIGPSTAGWIGAATC